MSRFFNINKKLTQYKILKKNLLFTFILLVSSDFEINSRFLLKNFIHIF